MSRHLLLTGGPGHDFHANAERILPLFTEQGIETVVVDEPGAALVQLDNAESGSSEPIDLLTVYGLHWRMAAERYAGLRERHAYELSPAGAALIDRLVRRGGGLLALHTAVICFDAEPTWHALCGASWNWESSSHPPIAEFPVSVTPAGQDHVLTAGLDDFVIEDELYGFLDEVDDIAPLLSGVHDGRAHPLLWARQVGAGRVVTDLLGHGTASIENPVHRTILTRAVAWLAQPPDAGVA